MQQELEAPRVRPFWPCVGGGQVAPVPQPQPVEFQDPPADPDDDGGALPDTGAAGWYMPLMFDPASSVPVKWDPETRDIDAPTVIDWPEAVLVRLHWRLLEDVVCLADPEATMLDKLDVLNWVFTEPEKDALPFSFVSCLKVVGCSPLTNVRGLGYVGDVDADTIRDLLHERLRWWLPAAFSIYPMWVLKEIAENPAYIVRQLERDPQWLNKRIQTYDSQGDLFA